MTRIDDKYTRVYVNGYDLSGYANAISSLDWTFAGEPGAAFSDEVMNILCGKCTIGAGDINTFLDNDAAGSFVQNNSGTGEKLVTVALGTNTTAIAGDPVFSWKFEQTTYLSTAGTGFTAATINVGSAAYGSAKTYRKPWGVLLHSGIAASAANTAAGIDDNGGASALGGIFVYHLLTSNGTVTLTAQEASINTNANFADITGATSGLITAAVTPKSGMIALATNADIKQFLRWQLAFGSASSATFVSAFIRNHIP